MLMSKAFPSAYLKSEDLKLAPNGEVNCKIESCDFETVGSDELPVLRFVGKSAGLVLNKTNSNTLQAAFGDDSDNWVGCAIEIFVAQVNFKGDTVDGLRVRVPQQSKPAPVEVVNVDDDSDVPF